MHLYDERYRSHVGITLDKKKRMEKMTQFERCIYEYVMIE